MCCFLKEWDKGKRKRNASKTTRFKMFSLRLPLRFKGIVRTLLLGLILSLLLANIVKVKQSSLHKVKLNEPQKISANTSERTKVHAQAQDFALIVKEFCSQEQLIEFMAICPQNLPSHPVAPSQRL